MMLDYEIIVRGNNLRLRDDFLGMSSITLLHLPQGPMLATRAIARADIIEALNSFNTVEMEVFMQGWYSEETQSVLHGLFAKK